MDLLEKYNQRVLEIYMQSRPNVNPDKAMSLLRDFTASQMNDIPCTLGNNITHENHKTTITKVCDWIYTKEPIITGNGTFFKQHAEYLSPAIFMLESQQKQRGVEKKKMYKFEKGSVEYTNAFTTQNNYKTGMNADYGGSGSIYAPFYSVYIPASTTLSAKYITTALICCLEFASNPLSTYSKCNSVNELFDMIQAVLRDTEDRVLIRDNFSVEEVLTRLLSLMSEDSTLSDVKMLKSYLQSLANDKLTKLMLAFNVHLVLERYLANDVSTVMDFYKNNPLPLNDLTGSKERMELETQLLNEAGFGKKVPDTISSIVDNIKKVVMDNCIYNFILNDNEVRAANMKRKIVCVTDTDSLMVHFAHYVDAFQANVGNFKQSCIMASALGFRLFIEGIIPKFVAYIAKGCNIKDEYYRNKFDFKNEYGYPAMTLAAKKMYAASMFVQEGVPRNPHKLQITGLSFKKRDAAEFLEPIMLELYDKYVLTPDTVQVDKILDEYYALRERLLDELSVTPSYFKVLSIKDIGSYSTDKALPEKMRGVLVWNNIMVDEEINPMDRAILVPLSWSKIYENSHIPEVAMLKELSERMSLDNIESAKKRGKYAKGNCKNPEMSLSPCVCLPEHYKEFPEWVSCIVNVEETVDKLLTPFKQLLGLFDVYMAQTKGGVLPSRMICI